MKTRTFPIMVTCLVMAFGWVALVPGTAHAADAVEATIPFGFTAGTADLPAGSYMITLAWTEKRLTVVDLKSRKSIMVPFITALSRDAHSTSPDARVVFDKVGDNSYTLSEVWWPGADGVLVGTAKDKHEHKVISVKK